MARSRNIALAAVAALVGAASLALTVRDERAGSAAEAPSAGLFDDWRVVTVAGAPAHADPEPLATTTWNHPSGVAEDPAGNLYVGERFGHRIRRVAPDGTVTVYAGTGERGFSGDGGPAVAAELAEPWGLV